MKKVFIIFFVIVAIIYFVLDSTPLITSYKHRSLDEISDSLALIDFYNHTNGADWNERSNWLYAPMKKWRGIDVNKNNRVTSIHLESNNIKGDLPESLTRLSELETLNLTNNDIRSLPSGMGSLKKLKTLNLNNNSIGSVPESIYSIKDLRYLFLIDNKISSLPNGISKLENLESLFLGENRLNYITNEIGHLKKLTYLSVRNNNITRLPDNIWEMGSLKYLDIKGNDIEGLPQQYVDSKGVLKLSSGMAIN